MKKPVHNENGITVKQLKDWVMDLPEKNEYGDDFEVWVEDLDGTSNVAKSIWPLNARPSGSDIILHIQ